jgi:hypothetical protein
MELNVLARIRKLLEGVDASAVDSDTQLTLTPQLELLTAPGASAYSEIVRMGRAFYTGTTAAVAAVVAVPSTAVLLALYNNAPDGGRSLVVDWVGASMAAKTAAAGQAQLLVLNGQVREATPANSALVVKKANGYGAAGPDTVARSIISGTALPATTGIAADWVPLGPAVGFPGAAATPGGGLWAPVDGRFIVAPGRYFAITVIADVVGSTFLTQVGWHEKQLNLA